MKQFSRVLSYAILAAVFGLGLTFLIRGASRLHAWSVRHVLTATVINTEGVDNDDRHFVFGDKCVFEHGWQSSTSGDRIPGVHLERYTAPSETVTGDHCPTGTWYVSEPIK